MADEDRKRRGKAHLVPDTCIACGRCEAVCPMNAITYDEKGEPVIDFEACTGCGECVKSCPAAALKMSYPEGGDVLVENEPEAGPEGEGRKEEGAKGVWVFLEQRNGQAEPVSRQLFGKGAELAADLSSDLSAIILGSKIGRLAELSFAAGARNVYMMDDPLLDEYRTGPYAEGIAALARKYRPEVLLIGATAIGRDLASAVATRLETGLTADCTGLSIDRETRLLDQTRPAFGGNIMATIVCEHARPQMASVRPDVFPAAPAVVPGRVGLIFREPCPVSEKEVLTRVLDIAPIEKTGVDIRAADIVVSGGRGMASPEQFGMLRELAALLGGVVAGSRSAVDAGFTDYERQVGQTGKTVRPRLYIACGISGAIQHLVGMQNADHIIAINKDAHAPIFEVADLAIVGDVFEIIPRLIEVLRKKKGMENAKEEKERWPQAT
ncbi:MAG: FAD-binding protein [Syntrophorhabdales bacterium]|jgi:electron transfer flavoprotein alpha subunit